MELVLHVDLGDLAGSLLAPQGTEQCDRLGGTSTSRSQHFPFWGGDASFQ